METTSNLDSIITVLLIIGFGWGIISRGKRKGFNFFLPYIISIISLLYICQKIPEFKDGFMEQFLIIMGVSLVIGLIEYYSQPFCHNCFKRFGMKKISETDHVNYDFVESKTYKIKNRRGNEIGEYEGHVHKRRVNFKGIYKCKYCGTISSFNEYDENEL